MNLQVIKIFDFENGFASGMGVLSEVFCDTNVPDF